MRAEAREEAERLLDQRRRAASSIAGITPETVIREGALIEEIDSS